MNETINSLLEMKATIQHELDVRKHEALTQSDIEAMTQIELLAYIKFEMELSQMEYDVYVAPIEVLERNLKEINEKIMAEL